MDSHDEAVPLSSEHLRQLVLESIPRFEDFEHEVENIIPLREGRNVEALARLYSIDPNERQEILEEVKSDYEDELKNLDQVEDPLDIFVRYIRWTIEMFPQGHNQHSDLVGLLQRATITFQDDPRYKSDTRYLHCWMQYAKWVEDANEIFLFLMKKNIAQNLATFYEEYSAYYERKRRYREAWEVLDLGVNRNAQPIRRLEKYRDRFQARLAQRQIVEADPVPQAREQMREMARGQRMMLGQKTDSDARYSAPSNVINNSSSSTSSSAAAAASSSREGRSFGNNSADSTAIPNARFSVYVEPEPASSVPRPAAATSPSPSPSTTSYIPSVRSRHRQENRQEVFKMAGTTLPMKNYVPPPSQAITVFRDEDDQSAEPSQPPPKRTKTNGPLLTFSEAPPHAEQLRKHPLVDITSSHTSHPYRQSQRAQQKELALETWFTQMKPKFIKSSNSAGKTEYIAAIKDIIGPNSEQLSFEELRAQHLQHKNNPLPSPITNFDAPPAEGFFEDEQASLRPAPPSPTENYTTETRAAMQIVGSMFDSGKPITPAESWHSIPLLERIRPTQRVNENEGIELPRRRTQETERMPFQPVSSLAEDDSLPTEHSPVAESSSQAAQRSFHVFRDD